MIGPGRWHEERWWWWWWWCVCVCVRVRGSCSCYYWWWFCCCINQYIHFEPNIRRFNTEVLPICHGSTNLGWIDIDWSRRYCLVVIFDYLKQQQHWSTLCRLVFSIYFRGKDGVLHLHAADEGEIVKWILGLEVCDYWTHLLLHLLYYLDDETWDYLWKFMLDAWCWVGLQSSLWYHEESKRSTSHQRLLTLGYLQDEVSTQGSRIIIIIIIIIKQANKQTTLIAFNQLLFRSSLVDLSGSSQKRTFLQILGRTFQFASLADLHSVDSNEDLFREFWFFDWNSQKKIMHGLR